MIIKLPARDDFSASGVVSVVNTFTINNFGGMAMKVSSYATIEIIKTGTTGQAGWAGSLLGGFLVH